MTDETDTHVGPIIFANETARSQLVDEGEVVTFRARQRTTGDTWWRKSRTGPKQGDVTVEHITPVREGQIPFQPDELIEKSGFDSPADWEHAIYEENGEYPDGHLYRVTERDSDD